MPKVGDREYGYTPEGIEQAKMDAEISGEPIQNEQSGIEGSYQGGGLADSIDTGLPNSTDTGLPDYAPPISPMEQADLNPGDLMPGGEFDANSRNNRREGFAGGGETNSMYGNNNRGLGTVLGRETMDNVPDGGYAVDAMNVYKEGGEVVNAKTPQVKKAEEPDDFSKGGAEMAARGKKVNQYKKGGKVLKHVYPDGTWYEGPDTEKARKEIKDEEFYQKEAKSGEDKIKKEKEVVAKKKAEADAKKKRAAKKAKSDKEREKGRKLAKKEGLKFTGGMPGGSGRE